MKSAARDKRPSGSVFKATGNRFSGEFSVDNAESFDNLQVLEGNIISCQSIPDKDPDSHLYICESRYLDDSLIYMGVVGGISIILIGIFFVASTLNVASVKGRCFKSAIREVAINISYFAAVTTGMISSCNIYLYTHRI